MINRTESIKLNGIRIGRYRFPAKPKGSSQPFCYMLHIDTKPTFVDAAGHAVSVGLAVQVREVVINASLSVEPPESCFIQTPSQCE